MRCECEELESEGRKKNENTISGCEKSLAIYMKQVDDTHHHNQCFYICKVGNNNKGKGKYVNNK